jgi:glycosyltransferase involved in cell wall biosynthesis
MKTIAQMHPSWADSAHTRQLVALEGAVLTRAKHLHANSDGILAKVREEYDIVGAGGFVVPLGVPDRRPEFSRRAPDGRIRVLFVSRLERRKGVDTFLDAAVLLLPEFPRLEIVVVGKDTPNTEMSETYREAFLRTHGRDRDLAERVRFVGEVGESELYQFYADCDVFCVPSRYESFGLVYVEAMMFGVPVVATRVGGVPEVVQHGHNGFLVEPEDPKALAVAVRRLIADDELRAELGRESRRLYEERFTVPVMARGVARELTRIIDEHHGRPTAAPRGASSSAVAEGRAA